MNQEKLMALQAQVRIGGKVRQSYLTFFGIDKTVSCSVFLGYRKTEAKGDP